MSVEKSSVQLLTFTGAGCRAEVTNQVILVVEVPGGRQTINFPVIQLPQVVAMLSMVAADVDVLALVEANTPEPEPEPEPEAEPKADPEVPTAPEVEP